MNRIRASLFGVVFIGCTPAAAHQEPGAVELAVGDVTFPTSCAPEVQPEVDRAVAMLHSFWYERAEAAFRSITERDADCAIAYWGMAMSRFHQLWEPGGPELLAAGRATLASASAIKGTSERERDYIEALKAFYHGDPDDTLARMQDYEAAMATLYAKYPEDREARVFYALSILGTAFASPADKTLARQKRAGELLESVLVEQPNHPGVVHYIIHAYDYPELADRALAAARRYAVVAPDAPHALHMPSHIFTRLGLWEESIATNIKSANSARRDNWTGEELHAKDYLVYAYLQGARDSEAGAILGELPETRDRLEPGMANEIAGLFAIAAIPARYVLERGQWSDAARLTIDDANFPGGGLCWIESVLYFARGVGAAKIGDTAGAGESAHSLETCRRVLEESGDELWAGRVEAQWRAVVALREIAEGRENSGLAELREASNLEDSIDKPPITPGQVIPVRELLGDALLENGRPSEALEEYRRVLEAAPGRFRSIYGAARAADAIGDEKEAQKYFRDLLSLARSAAPGREELQEARARVEPGQPGARRD